jgi:arginine decarboxylase
MGRSLLITSRAGEARTELAVLDAALLSAGVGNFNLIRLSSVIPAGSTIVEKRPELPASEWGYRLYVVRAETGTSQVGAEAWAGIGWTRTQRPDVDYSWSMKGGSGRVVESLIQNSLASMRASREDTFGSVQMVTRGVRCNDQPVCAAVPAVYASVPW